VVKKGVSQLMRMCQCEKIESNFCEKVTLRDRFCIRGENF